jgi:hypothetical protein
VVFATLVPVEHISAISAFVGADAGDAQDALQALTPEIRESFQFVLGFDFLYDLVHNNLVAMWLAWGALRIQKRVALVLASGFAWVLWMDSALNLVEHLVFRHILSSGNLDPWHAYGSAVFGFRTGSLVAGALVAAILHVYASRRIRFA